MKKMYFPLIVLIVTISTITAQAQLLREGDGNLLPVSLSYSLNNTIMDQSIIYNKLNQPTDSILKVGSGVDHFVKLEVYPFEFSSVGFAFGFKSGSAYINDSIVSVAANNHDTIPNVLHHTSYDLGLSYRKAIGSVIYSFGLAYRYDQRNLKNDASVVESNQHSAVVAGSIRYFPEDATGCWFFNTTVSGSFSKPFVTLDTRTFQNTLQSKMNVYPKSSYSYGVETSIYSIPLKSLYYGIAPEIAYANEKNDYFSRTTLSVGINIHSYLVREKILSVGYANFNGRNHAIYCTVNVMPLLYHIVKR